MSKNTSRFETASAATSSEAHSDDLDKKPADFIGECHGLTIYGKTIKLYDKPISTCCGGVRFLLDFADCGGEVVMSGFNSKLFFFVYTFLSSQYIGAMSQFKGFKFAIKRGKSTQAQVYTILCIMVTEFGELVLVYTPQDISNFETAKAEDVKVEYELFSYVYACPTVEWVRDHAFFKSRSHFMEALSFIGSVVHTKFPTMNW